MIATDTGSAFKVCVTCKQEQPIGNFHNDKKYKDGKCTYCRTCYAIRQKEYVQRLKDGLVTQKLENTTRICAKCKIEKPIDNFYKILHGHRRASYCKTCQLKKSKEDKLKPEWKDKLAELRIKKREYSKMYPGRHWKEYGINLTVEEYNERFTAQGGCCVICGRHASTMKRRLHVDHNHTTGQCRGLVCPHCNNIIDIVENKNNLIDKIKEYLNLWNGLE